MYFRRCRKPRYDRQSDGGRHRRKTSGTGFFILIVFALCAAISWFLGNLSTQMAVSDATDIVTLSTDILNSVIESTDNGVITVGIPLGNLTGLNLLLNKGPDVDVQIIMLTSSRVDFRNEVVSCGINQAKYQLVLEVTIDIDILIPWGTESTSTVTEVIVADTVIVGKVPDTYLNMEN